MVNSKFFVMHLKQLWVILFIFCCFAILFIGADLIGNQYFSTVLIDKKNGKWDSLGLYMIGAGGLLFPAFIIVIPMLMSFILSLLLISRFFIRDINRGYIGSWLTLPLSRINIIFTKLFVSIIYLSIYHFISLAFQEMLFGSILKDFNKEIGLGLIGLNVTMYLTSLLFFSLCWFITNLINKSAVSLAICSILLAIFVSFYLVGTNLSKEISPLYILRYFTFLAFTTNPFTFDEDSHHQIIIVINDSTSLIYKNVILATKSWAWQIPVTIVVSVPLFIGGILLMRNKNFSI